MSGESVNYSIESNGPFCLDCEDDTQHGSITVDISEAGMIEVLHVDIAVGFLFDLTWSMSGNSASPESLMQQH